MKKILAGIILLSFYAHANAAADLAYESLNWTQYTGNGDSVINRGESVYLRPVIHNSGTSGTDGVIAWFTTTSPYVSFAYQQGTGSYPYNNLSYGTIGAGVSGATSDSDGLVTFAANTPPGTQVTITLNIKDTYGNTWTSNFSVGVWATDSTPPIGQPPVPYSATPYTNNLVFLWGQGSAADAESGISGYHLQVGTNPAADDSSIFDGELYGVAQKQVTPIVNGRVYYARARAINGAHQYGSWTNWGQGVTAKLTSPGAPSGITSFSHPDGSQYPLPFRGAVSGPADVSGISGYYWKVDQNPATIPTSADYLAAADVEAKIPLADGNWVFHVVAKDGAGNVGNSAIHYNFSVKSTVEPGASTTIQSADGTKLTAPAGAVPSAAQVFISTPAEIPAVPANSGMSSAGISREFSLSSGLKTFQKSMTIQIPYALPLPAGVSESALKLFHYNESGNTWQLVPGSSADVANKFVYGQTDHFSIFAVMAFTYSGGAVGDLSNYPNPFSPLRGQTTKIRYNLDSAREVKIIIYDPYGMTVWEQTISAGATGAIAGPNEVVWDGKNGKGSVAAAGGYICLVKSGGQKQITKIAVK